MTLIIFKIGKKLRDGKEHKKNTWNNNDIKNNRNVKETIKLITDEIVKAGRTTSIGDSIIRFIRGDKLSRKHNVKCLSFPGNTIEDMSL